MPVEDDVLLERNLRGLAALQRVVGRHAGTVVEFDGAVGCLIDHAPDYPWLNALVCEPGADFRGVLARVLATAELASLAVWACDAEQADVASQAGFTTLVARVPAMSIELDRLPAGDGASGPVSLAEVGAISDAGYSNQGGEVERTLARIPASCARPYGRRDAGGRVVAGAVLLRLGDDCSVQYVATRPDAQRLGHGRALVIDALAQARARGADTASLQASEAGARLYRRLGFRTVGELELRRRAAGLAPA